MSELPAGIESFTDEDAKETMRGALRLELWICVVAVPLVWWKLGWQSAALLAVGAGISASGVWEWLRLMTTLMARMDAGGEARPVALVLVGFFVRLGVAVGVLYGSLKTLNGSVYAVAAGLGLGVFCLSVQAVRMMKAWTE